MCECLKWGHDCCIGLEGSVHAVVFIQQTASLAELNNVVEVNSPTRQNKASVSQTSNFGGVAEANRTSFIAAILNLGPHRELTVGITTSTQVVLRGTVSIEKRKNIKKRKETYGTSLTEENILKYGLNSDKYQSWCL